MNTRSGDVPTDRLFTGQRLDGTGLYYYGARYYEPSIGRFISADTLVQDFNNPQTLNRYSYTTNNPLKYIDPSGNKVEFIESPTAGFNTRLAESWDKFEEAAPDVAKYLNECDEVIEIRWRLSESGSHAGCTGLKIELNANLIMDTSEVAVHIAHESVHAIINTFDLKSSNSIYEEVVAFQFENYVAYELGVDYHPYETIVNKVNTGIGYYSLDDQLYTAQYRFEEKGVYGDVEKILPSEANYNTLQDYFVDPYYLDPMWDYYYYGWDFGWF